MTKDQVRSTEEALKLSLEALENFADVIKYDNEQDDIGCRACCYVLSYDQHSENCKATKAITVIKQALAAPVQEPVAYRSRLASGSYTYCNTPQFFDNAEPLYTTPPAAPDLQAELDATNRQVEILSDALAESRREIDALVALARADEREACAKVCEEPGWNAANWCAKAIRARGNT